MVGTRSRRLMSGSSDWISMRPIWLNGIGFPFRVVRVKFSSLVGSNRSNHIGSAHHLAGALGGRSAPRLSEPATGSIPQESTGPIPAVSRRYEDFNYSQNSSY